MTAHPLSQDYVASCFARAEAAGTAREKGQALEDAVAHVLGSIPGVRVVARDKTNVARSEEIDLGVLNEQDPDGLSTLFEPWFFVECKNWNGAVDAKAVRDFAGKLKARARAFGLIVAAEGITGDASELRSANDVVRGELQDGREIVVVTRRHLLELKTSGDFVDLLLRLRSNLVMSQTIADEPWRATEGGQTGDSSRAVGRAIGIAEALRAERERVAGDMLARAAPLPQVQAHAVQRVIDDTNALDAAISHAQTSNDDEGWRGVLDAIAQLGGTAISMLERVSQESWTVEAIAANAAWAAPNVRISLPGSRLFEALLAYYSLEVSNGEDMDRESAAFGLIGLLIESSWRLNDALHERDRED